MGRGKGYISGSKPWIFGDSLLKVFLSILVLLIPRAFTLSVEMVSALEIRVQRSEIYRSRGVQPRPFFGRHLGSNLPDYGACYFALQGQRILQVTLIGLRPDVLVLRRVDQLGCNVYAITRALHGALDDCVNVQFTRDLRQSLVGIFVNVGGRS